MNVILSEPMLISLWKPNLCAAFIIVSSLFSHVFFVLTRPSPVVAELKLTAKPKTLVSDVLKPLIATVKVGLLKSSIDGIPISFKLSEAGFRFVTSSGKSF